MKKIILSLALIVSSSAFAQNTETTQYSKTNNYQTNVLMRPASLSQNTIKMINEVRGEDPAFRQRHHRMKVWCQKNKYEEVCKKPYKTKKSSYHKHHHTNKSYYRK